VREEKGTPFAGVLFYFASPYGMSERDKDRERKREREREKGKE